MHYYKRNIGDYAKKAGRLSMLQHGSYTLLIDACYDREQFPTHDEAIEWTWASTTAEIEAVEFVLRKFFTLENGIYVQKRIQEEIEAYHGKSATNKRIAQEREANKHESSTKRAQVVCEMPPNQEPITNNQEPVKTQRKKRADDFDVHEKLMAFGVSDSVANDFLAIRKRKRAPLTETALVELQREASKADMTLHQALEKCCARGWQGFEASWLQEKNRAGPAYAESPADQRSRKKHDFWEQINGTGSGQQRGAVPAAIDGEAVRVD